MQSCNNRITRLAGWSCDIHAPFSTVEYKGGTLGAVKHKVKDMVNSVVEGGADVMKDLANKEEEMGVSSASQVRICSPEGQQNLILS